MLALSVSEENVKIFMQKLLKEETFDSFEVRTVVISGFARFEISEEKLETEEEGVKRQICRWEKIRPFVFSILKGEKKPGYMKTVFSLDAETAKEISDSAAALFLNMVFDGEKVSITTGMAQKTFSLDKAPEKRWDDYAAGFLSAAGIIFESQL